MELNEKLVYGTMGVLGSVSIVGSVLVAKQVMDKKISRSTKLWKKVCIRTAGYTVACGAAVIGTYKTMDFIAADVPKVISILAKSTKS